MKSLHNLPRKGLENEAMCSSTRTHTMHRFLITIHSLMSTSDAYMKLQNCRCDAVYQWIERRHYACETLGMSQGLRCHRTCASYSYYTSPTEGGLTIG